MAELHVVLHLDDPEEKRLGIGLTNLENLIRAAGGPAHVNAHFVVNGPGVKLFKELKQEFSQRLLALAEAGIHFVACQNALKANAMDPSELPEGMRTVPAGILELVRLQQEEGCAYIKP
ncbi:DsrE family protein [Desulfobotulus sp. H1]|uniref:DsrE family protein n=1 Tax=Desulfobotulus pelophilus TaxID=2823377 RepID=A0ABT3N8C9_9BACT|nr:DsrE family protein [Desulfobotulus pelophilus]MCW7753710.1 DsrE family protein [Desulfobotulus pelophilus]